MRISVTSLKDDLKFGRDMSSHFEISVARAELELVGTNPDNLETIDFIVICCRFKSPSLTLVGQHSTVVSILASRSGCLGFE